jgi:hypothetical protein
MIRSRGNRLTLLLLSMVFTVAGIAIAAATMGFGRAGSTTDQSARLAEAAGAKLPSATGKRVVRLARAGVPTLQNDPTAPDYDALRLTQLAIPANEIFASEPRDERWAPVIERRISQTVDDDLASALAGARVAKIECHTMVCRMEIAADDRETLRKASHLFQYAPRAPRTDYVGGDGRTTTVYLTFDRETRDPDAHQKWYSAVREISLRELRAAPRQPSDPPVPSI